MLRGVTFIDAAKVIHKVEICKLKLDRLTKP